MRAEDVVSLQLELLTKFADSNLLYGMVNNAAKEVGLPSKDADDSPSAAYSMATNLAHAPGYRLRESISDNLWPTAREHSDDMEIGKYSPPTDRGFAVFEKPWMLRDRAGNRQVVHFVSWAPVGFVNKNDENEIRYGHMVLLWNDGNREPDHYSNIIISNAQQDGVHANLRKAGYYFPIQFVTFLPGTGIPAGPLMLEISPESMRAMRARGENPPSKAPSAGRLLLALWDLMERIPEAPEGKADESAEHVRKSVVKQAQRGGLTNPTVREVALHAPRRPQKLRDPDVPKGTRTPVDHRVVVREHERMQAYGPGRTLRKKITIRSYEYGPQNPPDYTPPHRVYRVG